MLSAPKPEERPSKSTLGMPEISRMLPSRRSPRLPVSHRQPRRRSASKRIQPGPLLLSFAPPRVAILVKNQVGDLPCLSEELYLGIYDL